jgi:hypothetical protein
LGARFLALSSKEISLNSMDTFIKKVTAIATVNKEIIQRVESRETATGFKYSIVLTTDGFKMTETQTTIERTAHFI